MDRQALIDKIKVLLDMSRRESTNPNEAAMAAERAQRLLQEFNVSEFDLNERTEPLDYIVLDFEKGDEWKSLLISVLARHNFCQSFRTGSMNGFTTTLIGDDTNRGVVLYLFESLRQQLEFLCARDWNKYRGTIPETKSRFSNAFYTGAVTAIYERLKNASRELETRSNALVVYNQNQLKEYTYEHFGTIGRRRTVKATGYAAALGYAAGEAAQMNKGVGSPTAPKQLGG